MDTTQAVATYGDFKKVWDQVLWDDDSRCLYTERSMELIIQEVVACPGT